jgi:hypothetical protein
LQTPLGQVPVLDQREGLAFANALVNGTLPAEPFYRAPGYGLLLGLLRWAGVSAGGLFSVALFLGAIFHVLSALCVARIARVWFDTKTALIAGLLIGLNPVLVHFAIQATDTTPALACFAAGLACVVPEFSTAGDRGRTRRWMGASLCWAAATVLRPNYLLVWLTLPVLAMLARRGDSAGGLEVSAATERDGPPNRSATTPEPDSKGGDTRGRVLTYVGAVTGVVLFVAVGFWQHHLCGRFGFMPAQGPYNLWAANEPGANGRYFTQKVALPAEVAEHNPTRAESLILFQRETGQPADDMQRVNAYWRDRFVRYVSHHPLSWLGLMGRKLYALFNDWEQYNNDTPAFQIARSPWLRWNPLSFGVLFVVAVLGWGRFASEARPAVPALGLVAAAAAVSALLFFVSARFRLPLTALLTLLASTALAGFIRAPKWLRRFSRTAAPDATRSYAPSRFLVIGAVGAVALTFSRFGGVHDTATIVQDHALLARAAATTGDDALAWREASAALVMRSDHPDALRLAVSSYFNLLLDGAAAASDEPRWAEAAAKLLAESPHESDLRCVAALALWRNGSPERALAEWRSLGRTPSAIAARLLAGDTSVEPAELPIRNEAHEPLVTLAAALRQDSAADARTRVIAWRLFRSRE